MARDPCATKPGSAREIMDTVAPALTIARVALFSGPSGRTVRCPHPTHRRHQASCSLFTCDEAERPFGKVDRPFDRCPTRVGCVLA